MFDKITLRFFASALAVAAALSGIAAYAQSSNPVPQVFVTSIGDVAYPFSPPPANGGNGKIDNMSIGSVTPAPGVFSSITNKGSSYTTQGAPYAATVSGTLTAANLNTRIITVLQGSGASSAQQLPLASAMDTAFPNAVAGTAFDFSVINISTNAAESASITTNTGWTLVGDMDIQANSAATTKSAGRFMARKTGTGAWTLYRLS